MQFEDPWVEPFVVTLAVLLQVVPALVVCCLAYYRQSKREDGAVQEIQDLKWERMNIMSQICALPVGDGNEAEQEVAVQSKQHEIDDAIASAEQAKQSGRLQIHCGVILSLFSCASLWLWVTFLVGCYSSTCLNHGPVLKDLVIFAAVMIPVCWLIMCVETLFSNEYKYLKHFGDLEHANSIIDEMKTADPYIQMRGEAYHYDLKIFTERREGERTLKTRQERIITATREAHFPVEFSVDESDDQIEGLCSRGLTRVRVNLLVDFGDEYTHKRFKDFQRHFISEMIGLDKNVNFSEERFINNYTKRILVYKDKSSIPVWMNTYIFLFVSFLGVSWMYRFIFKSNLSKTTYCIRKKVFVKGHH